MASLTNTKISDTYPLLLKIETNGIDGTLRSIEDGDGTASALQISTGAIDVSGTTNLDIVDIDGAVDMASTLTIGGDLTLPQKIVHSGDTDTYLSFGDDSLSLFTGGTNVLDFIYGNIYIKGNNKALTGYTTGGSAKELIKIDGSDVVQIGEGLNTTFAGNVVINKASNPTYLQIGSSLSDDPYMVFQSDGNTFAMGIDRSDSNKFKISDNATLGTNDRLAIDSSGNTTFEGTTTTFPVGGILRFGERGNLTHNSSNYNMTFNTNSLANAMTVTGTGNVLIGTTDDDARLMVKKVDGTSYGQFVTIEGDTTDNNNYSGISFKAGTLANAYPEIGVSNGGLMFQMSGGYHSSNYNNRTRIQLNGSDGHISFQTGGDPATEVGRFDSLGNFGIGVSGSNLNARITRAFSANKGLVIETAQPAIQFVDTADTNKYFTQAYDNGDMYFYNSASGFIKFTTNGSNVVTIDSNGSLGIGTTSPTAMLDVASSSNNDFPLKVRGNIDNDGGFTGIKFGYEADTGNYEKCAIKVEGTSGNVQPDFHILLNGAASSADVSTDNTDAKFSIMNNGDILFPYAGIPFKTGVDAGSGILAGGASFQQNTVGRMILYLGTYNFTSAASVARFTNQNGIVGSIDVSGSNTAFSTSSDYRLKENEVLIPDGLTRLNQLKPYRFNFKADADTTVDGFFAHEVSDIVPGAVFGEKDAVNDDGSIKSQRIDHSKLVPLLVKAVQELSAKVEALENA